jgi:hypothetical protein
MPLLLPVERTHHPAGRSFWRGQMTQLAGHLIIIRCCVYAVTHLVRPSNSPRSGRRPRRRVSSDPLPSSATSRTAPPTGQNGWAEEAISQRPQRQPRALRSIPIEVS